MNDKPRYLGVRELVEELARDLSAADLRRSYPSQAAFIDDINKVTHAFLLDRLVPLRLPFEIWLDVAEAGGPGIEPAFVFGTSFVPDMVIEVAGRPTVAVYARVINSPQKAAEKIGAVLGEAIVSTYVYPAALAFIYQVGQSSNYMHLLDRELVLDLWHSHKVKLVLRSSYSPEGKEVVP